MPSKHDLARELHVAANDLVRYLSRKSKTDPKLAADTRLDKLVQKLQVACDQADGEGW